MTLPPLFYSVVCLFKIHDFVPNMWMDHIWLLRTGLHFSMYALFVEAATGVSCVIHYFFVI
jgi:hypothetical protein